VKGGDNHDGLYPDVCLLRIKHLLEYLAQVLLPWRFLVRHMRFLNGLCEEVAQQ
jgi:hypothetical protein